VTGVEEEESEQDENDMTRGSREQSRAERHGGNVTSQRLSDTKKFD
jgi:hypothetical protein